jgi:hypothetical protein
VAISPFALKIPTTKLAKLNLLTPVQIRRFITTLKNSSPKHVSMSNKKIIFSIAKQVNSVTIYRKKEM